MVNFVVVGLRVVVVGLGVVVVVDVVVVVGTVVVGAEVVVVSFIFNVGMLKLAGFCPVACNNALSNLVSSSN